jgi:guanylate kinase
VSQEGQETQRGKLVILAGPSGVGKTSIVHRLLERPGRELSVSVTTRKPRAGEQDGVDYHFISEEEFRRYVREDGLAEHARVHDSHYGTPRQPLEDALRAGRTMFLDIDVQGAEQINARYPEAISIFVLPPSPEELERRLRGRRTDDPGAVARRLKTAREEIARQAEFDHRVVNDDLEMAVAEVEGIIADP